MLDYEKNLWKRGLSNVCGIDEVGRGPLAGPLVAGAVIWDKDTVLKWEDEKSRHWKTLLKINDSKKLSPKNRVALSAFIRKYCKKYSIIEISNEEIDKTGVGKANKKALELSVLNMQENLRVDHILVDYFLIFDGRSATAIPKGDEKSLSIASASIIAKVYRDNVMKTKYHRKFPSYGFDTNVGYGTKKHINAIKKHGLCEIHRKSFCRNYVNG